MANPRFIIYKSKSFDPDIKSKHNVTMNINIAQNDESLKYIKE